MDLALYVRVLWRFRIVVAAGLALAILLAFFAVERVSISSGRMKLAPRKAEVWKTDSFLLVTQSDFPWGRSVTRYTRADPTTGKPPVPKGDPQRLATLTALYAGIAMNDVVRARIGLSSLRPSTTRTVTVTAVPAPAYSTPAIQPILDFAATGATPAAAVALAQGATNAFRQWLQSEQQAGRIAPADRVVLWPYTRATPPVLVSSTGKTLPVIIFLTILGITVGLALVLENLRPRPAAVRRETVDELHAERAGPARRTA